MILELVNDDGSTLNLMDRVTNGIAIAQIDLGRPEVREVLEVHPNADGAIDYTVLVGPRVISMTGSAFPCGVGSRQAALAQFMRFARPNRRQQLVYQFDDDATIRSLTMRVTDWTAPITTPGLTAFSVAWKAADPIAYSVAGSTVSVPPGGNFTGRTYPLSFNRSYPASYGGAGVVTVTNHGDYLTWPLVRMFGPLTNPSLTWQDGSGQLVFAGISVLAGDWLEIDTKAKTVTLDGDSGANRYSFLDFTQTVWAPLQPGDNLLRFSATAAAAPAQVEIDWSDAWLF